MPKGPSAAGKGPDVRPGSSFRKYQDGFDNIDWSKKEEKPKAKKKKLSET